MLSDERHAQLVGLLLVGALSPQDREELIDDWTEARSRLNKHKMQGVFDRADTEQPQTLHLSDSLTGLPTAGGCALSDPFIPLRGEMGRYKFKVCERCARACSM